MVQVVVIEPDDGVRSGLHDLLSLAGYHVPDQATSVEAGLAVLEAAPRGMLVLISNAYPDHHLAAHFFEQVAADTRLATRHHYILLSSTPSHLPAHVAGYVERLHAQVCPKPFDMDTLLACLSRGAEQLAARQPARTRCERDA